MAVNLFNVKKAFNYLEHASIGTKINYTPRGIKNCNIFYEKPCEGAITKTVERADGTILKGTFWGNANDYELTSSLIQNSRGRIERSYLSQNYDNCTYVDLANGDSLVRLAHKNRPGFLDTYHPAGEPSQSGDFTSTLKNMISYIMGK